MKGYSKPDVNLSGLDEETKQEILRRIEEFEDKHEPNIVANGNGWIPRLERNNVVFAAVINLLITAWLVFALI